ncbi:MAG: hypothetical protein M3065_03580 [Actinomycetota bacterium]|nr:hypothetical protein [Actinomycetota bacterium]
MNRSQDGTRGTGSVIVAAGVGGVAGGDPTQELEARASASRDGQCRAETVMASNCRPTNTKNERRHPPPTF